VTSGLGIGLDLLEIARLERALERRPRLAERLFTDGERAYAATRARPGQHLALGLEAWSFRDIEVIATQAAPVIALHGAVAERAAALGVEVRISLTHTGDEAAAVAIIAPV
jgi:holo-[acyl-carrier protein] synthase